MTGLKNWQKSDAIGVTLVLASLIGLLWVFLIAPWEHHDEPNHFQYQRQIIDRGTLATPEKEDWHVNRQILKSMIWNGFFKRLGSEPPLPPPRQPTYLPGYPQYKEPPAYYVYSALAVFLARSQNITRQLIVGRIMSFFLYLLTIVAAWGVIRELTKPGNPLRWMVPVTVAFIPGFVDIMTAFNNDAGAVVVISFFIWACVRLLRFGFKWLEFLWAVDLAFLGWLTKSTASLAIPLLGVVFIFSVLRGKIRWVAWVILGICLIVISTLSFQYQDARFFYRSTSQVIPTRIETEKAILGKSALQINTKAYVTPVWMPKVFQPLRLIDVGSRLGKPVTLGVWMWASRPVKVETPVLVSEAGASSYEIQLSREPIFLTVHSIFDDDTARFWINLNPVTEDGEEALIFYDGMVLAEGTRPLETTPIFADSSGNSGVWGTESFVNLVRNGSFESTGLRISPMIDNFLAEILPDNIRPSLILTSLIDFSGAGWYYVLAINRIFKTFWGFFGWAHIPLQPSIIYTILGFFTSVGILGSFIALFRRIKKIHWGIVLFLGLAVSIAMIATISRGVIYLTFVNMFFPVARYIAPVIIPNAMVLAIGWSEIIHLIGILIKKLIKKPPYFLKLPWLAYGMFVITWLFFVLYSILVILQYYRTSG